MVPESFRVTRAHRETRDTVTIELAPAGGDRPFAFAPGQFNMIYAFGIGEVPISISGDPGRPEVLLHTVRAVGAVSRAICAVRPGDTLGVRGPFGSGWPVADAEGRDVVVVGGGIGLAPLRPVIDVLRARRERYGSVSVLYGCRTPDDVLFASALRRLRGRFDLDVQVTVDASDAGWRGGVGPVTTLIPRAAFDADRTAAFVCGPEIMMRYVMRSLVERGVPMDRISLSAERNMKCAIGFCGHCQLGPAFVCRDGPVLPASVLEPLMNVREL